MCTENKSIDSQIEREEGNYSYQIYTPFTIWIEKLFLNLLWGMINI